MTNLENKTLLNDKALAQREAAKAKTDRLTKAIKA